MHKYELMNYTHDAMKCSQCASVYSHVNRVCIQGWWLDDNHQNECVCVFKCLFNMRADVTRVMRVEMTSLYPTSTNEFIKLEKCEFSRSQFTIRTLYIVFILRIFSSEVGFEQNLKIFLSVLFL